MPELKTFNWSADANTASHVKGFELRHPVKDSLLIQEVHKRPEDGLCIHGGVAPFDRPLHLDQLLVHLLHAVLDHILETVRQKQKINPWTVLWRVCMFRCGGRVTSRLQRLRLIFHVSLSNSVFLELLDKKSQVGGDCALNRRKGRDAPRCIENTFLTSGMLNIKIGYIGYRCIHQLFLWMLLVEAHRLDDNLWKRVRMRN